MVVIVRTRFQVFRQVLAVPHVADSAPLRPSFNTKIQQVDLLFITMPRPPQETLLRLVRKLDAGNCLDQLNIQDFAGIEQTLWIKGLLQGF